MWIFQREKKYVLCIEGTFSKLIMFMHCGYHKQNTYFHHPENKKVPCAPFGVTPFPTTPVPGILNLIPISTVLDSHLPYTCNHTGCST